MPKMELVGSYRDREEVYGPGEAEVPEHLAKQIREAEKELKKQQEDQEA